MRSTDQGKADNKPSELERLVARATLVLAWERVWPSLAAGLTCAGLFVCLSWLGLWLPLPTSWRIVGVGAFALFGLFCLVNPLRGTGWPSRGEALARLDRDSGLPHRPASGLADALVNPTGDAGTQALWSVHQNRLRDLADRLSIAAPRPDLPRRDPFALRAATLIACVAAGFVAGPEKGQRFAAAFDWRGTTAVEPGFRFDAWIDPPLYTGKPPILINPKTTADLGQLPRRVEAPTGSTLIVRSAGDRLLIATKGGLTLSTNEKAPDPKQPESEHRYTLTGDAEIGLSRAGRSIGAFEIIAVPDRAPNHCLDRETLSQSARFPDPRLQNRRRLWCRQRRSQFLKTGAAGPFSGRTAKNCAHLAWRARWTW